MPKRNKVFTACDGKLLLKLTPAPEGGYCVTSPMDPELITQGETLEECFRAAHSVRRLLRRVRSPISTREKTNRPRR